MAVRCKSTLCVMLLLSVLTNSADILSSDEPVSANPFSANPVSASTGQEPQCDLTLAFKKSALNDGLMFTNPGLMTRISVVAQNVGDVVCPRQRLKLLRYQGRQGWVEGEVTALKSLLPGGSTELVWVVHPQQEGYYTYKPQFVGGLIDADLSNHKPVKKFQAIFRTHD